MGNTLQDTTPLGGINEAKWWPNNNLVIVDTKDESFVVLQQKEIEALRALIAPPVTNKQFNKLLIGLDAVAREYGKDDWGLPFFYKKSQLAMCEVIRDWLATLNQSPAPSPDCEETKE